MSPRRRSVPDSIADAVLFESDRQCCICRVPWKVVQLHHLDGSPGNNTRSNLAVLCLDHHSEASKGNGLGRGLSPGLIRKYRDDWLAMVKARRAAKLGEFVRDGGA